MRLLLGTAARVVDRDSGSRPIDKQFLAGLVFLAQHHVLLPAPALKQLTETRIAIAVRVGLPVLLPEQLLGQVSMHLPLAQQSPASATPPGEPVADHRTRQPPAALRPNPPLAAR